MDVKIEYRRVISTRYSEIEEALINIAEENDGFNRDLESIMMILI